MSGLARFLIAFSMLFLLAACGGGDADAPWDGTTSDAAGSDQTIDDVGTGSAVITIGSGSGSSFNSGVLSIAVTSLSAGGQTSVRATLADADGNLFQESASVTFTSNCKATGLATIESPVSATGGIVTTTYVAKGCSGTDTIRATVTVNSATSSATGQINVQPAEIGSMEFISAEPAVIGLRGVGLTEVSRVTFMVNDQNGNPVTQQLVSFNLSTTIGGTAIPAGSQKATSDVNGLVTTDVRSGTVPTAVRVIATLDSNPLISTQSDGLIISTGVSDQNSISLSAEVHNPEGWRIDGTEVGITVHAADHFNNPVPDGTSVYFTTEGGQIQSQCQIADGVCSVVWTSSNPRPANARITILASMLGEESFTDANGNGVLDFGDTAFANIPEAFRDDNEDGLRDPVLEEFIDFNANGVYDGSSVDPNYNGALCCDTDAVTVAEQAVAAGEDPGVCFGVTPISTPVCSAEKNINVRDWQFLIMAESFATITPIEGVTGSVINIPAGGVNVTFEVVGRSNGQIMPAGTNIEFVASNGTVEGDSSFTVPSSNFDASLGNLPGLNEFSILLSQSENEEAGDDVGTLRIKVTTPSGAITNSSPYTVND
ncbi:MAG: hypothetical protein KZQ82_04520 [Candidatus Thiodiazotropha sp. (ex Lucinoma annulata)]|nr:hypothetical protein [Candidatus Thiodiazotropha sp. (ex Lucinoma annulata)]